MAERNRQNIVFAIADDASHFGCYGHSFVKTPCIDKLAEEGIRFERAFTTNPKCAPSRAGILTGRQTWQLREGCDHYGYFPEGFNVFPDILETAGYHVGFSGKGWAPGDYGRCGRNRNPAGEEYNRRQLTPPEGSDISTCDYAANFGDFLSGRNQDQPFCFWYGCHEPHRPYKYGEGKRHGYDADEAVPPPYWPDEERIRQDMTDYAFEISWFDSQLEALLKVLDDTGELENTWIFVTSDNGAPFPRIKGQMYDDDFRLPLIVRPPGGMKTAIVRDELVSFIDFFPSFLAIGGLSDEEQSKASAGRSLLPLCTESSDSSSSGFFQRDYVLMGRERHDLGRENDTGYPVRCLRTRTELLVLNLKPDRWPAGNPETGFTNCDSSPTKDRILELNDAGKDYYFNLSFGKRPSLEFYNLESDPHCMHNLSDSPDYQDRIQSLKNILEKELKQSGDPRLLEGGDEFDHYEYTGDDRHSWKALKEGRWEKQPF